MKPGRADPRLRPRVRRSLQRLRPRHRAPAAVPGSHLAMLADRAGLAIDDVRYVNSVGAFVWWLFARRLRRVPTRGWSVKLYDRCRGPVRAALRVAVRPRRSASRSSSPWRDGHSAIRPDRASVVCSDDPGRGVRCRWSHGSDGLRGGARRWTVSSSPRWTRSGPGVPSRGPISRSASASRGVPSARRRCRGRRGLHGPRCGPREPALVRRARRARGRRDDRVLRRRPRRAGRAVRPRERERADRGRTSRSGPCS